MSDLIIDLPDPTGRMTARLGQGRAGARPRTRAQRVFDADHAITQDALAETIPPELLEELGLFSVDSAAPDRETCLLRPDLGRRLSESAIETLRAQIPPGADVQIFVSEGLSARAVTVNLPELLPALRITLAEAGLRVGPPFCVRLGRVGLLNAVNRFDVSTGSDFESFAVPTIMGEVRRHFRDNSWSVKVPRRLKELHLRLGSTSAELAQRLGRAPNASELADELDMTREEIVEGLIAGSSYNTLSIEGGGGGDEDAPAIADSLGDVDAALEQIEDRETLRPVLASLPERERTVLLLRFFDSQTQTQIAERIGVSQMHVSRLLAKSLARLRDQLE